MSTCASPPHRTTLPILLLLPACVSRVFLPFKANTHLGLMQKGSIMLRTSGVSSSPCSLVTPSLLVCGTAALPVNKADFHPASLPATHIQNKPGYVQKTLRYSSCGFPLIILCPILLWHLGDIVSNKWKFTQIIPSTPPLNTNHSSFEYHVISCGQNLCNCYLLSTRTIEQFC